MNFPKGWRRVSDFARLQKVLLAGILRHSSVLRRTKIILPMKFSYPRQTWLSPHFFASLLFLPLLLCGAAPPIQAVASVRLWKLDGTSLTLPASAFFLDGQGLPARLVWQGSGPIADPERSVNGIEVAFTAGFGAAPADVPATIRHALLLLVAHWYENREPVEIGGEQNAIPPMVSDLLLPFRRRRL